MIFFFARENVQKFIPVKTKIVRVKKIKISAREKSKSARENCHYFCIFNDGIFNQEYPFREFSFQCFVLQEDLEYWLAFMKLD